MNDNIVSELTEATLRTWHRADLQDLVSLLFGDMYEKEISEERLLRILHNPMQHIVVALVDDIIVGAALVSIVEMLSRKVALYEDFVINSEFRGMGIAQEMDRYIIELGRREDCDCMELLVPLNGVAVQRLHLKSGFRFRSQLPMNLVYKQWTRRT